MHTPRFSGQPMSAGDFVLLIIPSRPIRTNCENVGTVVPLFYAPRPGRSVNCAQNFAALSPARSKKRESTPSAERSTANPEVQPARNSARKSRKEKCSSGYCSERLTRLFGTGVPFRPLFYPIPSCNVPGLKIYPSNPFDEKPSNATQGNSPQRTM